MTPLRKHTFLRRVKDITLSATLSLALLNGAVLLQSCGNNQSDEPEQTETSFKQGVRTYITETAPGNFKITDEVQADPDKAGAIVSYYDGHRDTLSIEAAKKLVDSDESTRTYLQNPGAYQSYHHHSGLSSALLWGSLGYMLGRSTAPQYRADERRYGSGFYANSGAFDRSQQLRENVRTSRVVRTTRPSGGRSGFFGGRSRGFSS
ncbi:hypothetical protein GCM10028806_43080 [Spirosoma terrae]|uniref:UPF0323 domain-containing protein n=1 Tax=Spirosoma terrae TaxID=1968276 RepID=A0A6L9L0L7_9BACT|nr:hypothetical protein [Spirosoma terrae]NDU94026.1 hypothetical protein [Spirosoma terrae]